MKKNMKKKWKIRYHDQLIVTAFFLCLIFLTILTYDLNLHMPIPA